MPQASLWVLSVTEQGFSSAGRSARLFEPDTLAISKSGTIGRLGILKDRMCGNRAVINIRPRQEVCDPRFLFYTLLENRGEIIARAEGSVQKNLYVSALSSIAVPWRPLEEQREIAATLGALDDKIEVNRRMAATLEEMARALYRSWFVDFDPVHAKAQGRAPAHMDPATAALFPDRFGDDGLPEGWETGTLGDIARNRRDQVQPAAIDPETPYVGLEHMPRRSIAIGDWGKAGEVGSAKSRVSEGSFLFGKLRPYFHKVGLAPVDGICSTDILVVEPMESVWSGLVLSVISSSAFVEHANATSSGTRMPRANWGDMARYEIVMPDRKIADAFRDKVAPMHARIVQSIHENRTLAALRDALLPKLMSGELRVREAEAQVEQVA